VSTPRRASSTNATPPTARGVLGARRGSIHSGRAVKDSINHSTITFPSSSIDPFPNLYMVYL
jgi:hypothetical protein